MAYSNLPDAFIFFDRKLEKPIAIIQPNQIKRFVINAPKKLLTIPAPDEQRFLSASCQLFSESATDLRDNPSTPRRRRDSREVNKKIEQ